MGIVHLPNNIRICLFLVTCSVSCFVSFDLCLSSVGQTNQDPNCSQPVLVRLRLITKKAKIPTDKYKNPLPKSENKR